MHKIVTGTIGTVVLLLAVILAWNAEAAQRCCNIGGHPICCRI